MPADAGHLRVVSGLGQMSPHHYTSNCTGDTVYCNTCGRKTLHSVSSGRLGRCTEHEVPRYSKKQIEQQKKRAAEKINPSLFD